MIPEVIDGIPTGVGIEGLKKWVMARLRAPDGFRWFLEKYLGETLDPQQVELVEAIQDPTIRRISVTSGNS